MGGREGGDERGEGRGQSVKEGEWGLLTAVKGIYNFTTRTLRARSGISGKPGHSGKNPGDSTPPESSE
jgi:hypothetical protein